MTAAFEHGIFMAVMLIERFEIVGKSSAHPGDGPIIFCDGTGGACSDPAATWS